MPSVRIVIFACMILLPIRVEAMKAPPTTVAGPVDKPTGVLREQLWWVPVEVRGTPSPLLLETTLYRPQGDGHSRWSS